MAWIATAAVAIFLLYRFPRYTIWACLALFGIIAGGLGMNLLYEARQRDKREAEISRVELNISSSDPHCTDPQYPVWVSTLNRNDFVINSITVNLSATQPDHSSKLYEGYVTSDRILKPADGYGACWRLDDYKLENGKISGFEPKALDWEGSVSRIQKSD